MVNAVLPSAGAARICFARPADYGAPMSVESRPEGTSDADRRQIGWWLVVVAALVFCMVVLGGYTRLSQSGLSMVEWRPVTGWLPPLDDPGWRDAFAAYQRFPEYRKVNADIGLADFKRIYRVEYAHRLLGRAIGLAFLLPMLYFLAARKASRRLAGWLVALFVLGGLQGALGWFMVQSGLVDRPDVSHYRLVAHLGAALLIFGLLLWTAFALLASPGGGPVPVRRSAVAVLVLVVLQILAGGLVAGLDAGLVYNSFPLMGGRLVPAELFAMTPGWLNLLENPATVQFDHRVIAYLLVAAVAVLYWQARRARLSGTAHGMLLGLLAALAVQIGLGVLALVFAVPVALGVAHQAGALVVFAMALLVVHRLHPRSVLQSRKSMKA